METNDKQLIRGGQFLVKETKCEESLLLFPVLTTPRYNQYQAVFFTFVLLKKNQPGNEVIDYVDQ